MKITMMSRIFGLLIAVNLGMVGAVQSGQPPKPLIDPEVLKAIYEIPSYKDQSIAMVKALRAKVEEFNKLNARQRAHQQEELKGHLKGLRSLEAKIREDKTPGMALFAGYIGQRAVTDLATKFGVEPPKMLNYRNLDALERMASIRD